MKQSEDKSLLLYALFVQAVFPTREILSQFASEDLLKLVNHPHGLIVWPLDRAILRHLMGRIEIMSTDDLARLWHETNKYRRFSFASSMESSLSIIEKQLREHLLEALSSQDAGFAGVVAEIIRYVEPLRGEAEKLLEANSERIADRASLRTILGAHNDAKLCLSPWLARYTQERFLALGLNAEELEDFYADYPMVRQATLGAYRSYIAQLDTPSLLDLCGAGESEMNEAWYAELQKPERKRAIIDLLGQERQKLSEETSHQPTAKPSNEFWIKKGWRAITEFFGNRS